MKTLALLALALLTTPAAADVWVNKELSANLTSDQYGERYETPDGSTMCAYESKAISASGSQIIKWKCDNGTVKSVELLPHGVMSIDGVVFRPVDADGECDD